MRPSRTASRLFLVLLTTFALAAPGCLPSAPLIRQAAMMNSRGVAQLAADDLDAAEASFRLALEYNDRYSEPHCNLGLVALRRGQLRIARGHFRAAISRNRDFATAWTNLGVALSRREDSADIEASPLHAADAYREALAIDPAIVEARVNLVRTLLSTGAAGEALAQSRRLVQLDDRNVTAQLLRAESALAAHSVREAAEAVTIARVLDARDLDVRMVGARVDIVLGATGAARRALRELVNEPAMHVEARALLAAIAMAEGDVTTARQEIAAAGPGIETNAAARAVIARLGTTH